MPNRRHADPPASLFRGGSLRRRFAVGVAVMLLPMLLLGGGSVFAYERSVKAGNRVADEAVSQALPIADLRAGLHDVSLPAFAAVFGGEPIGVYRTRAGEIERAFTSILAGSGLDEKRADVEVAFREWTAAKARFEMVLRSALMRLPPRDRYSSDGQALTAFSAALNRALAAMGRASHTAAADVRAEAEKAESPKTAIELLLVLGGLAAIFAAALIARQLSRSVIDPIVRLQEASRKLGRGDFSERVVVARDDEVGALSAVFNTMAEDLERYEADQRASQEGLVQAQRMEAIGQLAGGIAHDFNNLLLVVGSYADFLHESFEEDDPRRNDAAEIRHASDRAAALTRQLLTFSRRDVTRPVPLDVAATIARLEEMLRRTLTATIDLNLELEPALRPTVIDASQFEQAMLNLALNAQNAMPDGGTLTIRVGAAEVDEFSFLEGVAPGSYIVIDVSDTGHGMSEDVRSRAVEPFFTTRAETGGSGLGLASVYGIITGADGAITIDSAEGEGTTVALYLPTTAHDVKAFEAEEPARSCEQANGGVVLVAEDEPTIRELATRILTAQGYIVLAAATGIEALELARHSERIDVLLTDVIMPGMTGSELAATLSRDRPGLPIVYMSGYSDQVVAKHGVLDAGTLYLQKPFTSQELLGLLADTLALPV